MNIHNTCCHVLLAILFSFLCLQDSKATPRICTPSCHNQINLSLPQSGLAVITPAFMLSGSNNCSGNWTVTVTDVNGNIVPSNVVNCLYVGQLLMVSVQDTDTGVSCWGNILVEDKLPPTMTCADVTISCSDSTDPSNTGMPDVSDNCFGVPNLTYTDVSVVHNCSDPLYDVTIERTWMATDASENTTTCTQNIFLEKALLSNVVFPPMAIVDCTNPNLASSNTGVPTVGGASFDGFCNLKYGQSDGPQIPTCSGGYKFVRKFTVIDCCSNEILTGEQIIEVADTTPPVITCPANQTISTTSTSCTANLILPIATATDDCSTPTMAFSSTSGIISGNNITGLIEGIHTVQYIATDGCGNADTCEMQITVLDLIAPIAICDEFTVASLGSDGCVIIPDSVFNDGSFDNCCIDTFYVRRMGDSLFNHFVKFDCNDLGDTIMVDFKVEDKSGNMNFCMVEVTVQDKLAPSIVCPPNKTISCFDDYLDLGLVGQATASDPCGVDTIYFEDLTNIDPCTNVGSIIRTWIASDNNGNTDTCFQGIVLQDSGGTPSFNIPAEFTISCTGSTDPSNTGQATATGGGCTSYVIGFEDQLVVGLDVCDKHILRTWKFVNDCTNAIVFEGNQLINLIDDEAPMITCPTEVTIDDDAVFPSPFPDCEEPVVFSASAIDSCSGVVTFIGRTADRPVTFSSTDLSVGDGTYPVGTTVVTFTAEDACGNQATCNTNVIVIDDTDPFIGCGGIFLFPEPGQPIDLTQDVFVSIPIECSNPIAIRVNTTGLAQTVFTCDDLGSSSAEINLTLAGATIIDAAGNLVTCTEASVSIQGDACPDNPVLPPLFMAGATYNAYDEIVKDVEIIVSGDMDSVMTTQNQGNYFVGGLSTMGNYSVAPEKNNDVMNGLTTFDLVKIKRHILGIELLDSPYKIIAADASHDDAVTTFDLVQLKQIILQNWDELPNNKSWRFVNAYYTFSDWTNPFADDFPESIDCVDITESQNFMNFRAIKVGDVTENASVDGFIAADTKEGNAIGFNIENVLLKKEGVYKIPVYAHDIQSINAFQFTLNFDTDIVDFLEIEEAVLGKDDFGMRFVTDGLLTCSWIKEESIILDNGKVLFFIKVKAKKEASLQDVFSITSEKTKAFAYDTSEKAHGVELFFEDKKENIFNKESEFILYQNQPNPFSEQTEIRFYLPEDSDVELQILDVSGRIIKTISSPYTLGEHQVELKRNVFPSRGIYIYKLITPSFSASKKMTIIN